MKPHIHLDHIARSDYGKVSFYAEHLCRIDKQPQHTRRVAEFFDMPHKSREPMIVAHLPDNAF